MKFAAGLFFLLSILSLPADAQAMFTGDADEATRIYASNTSGRDLPPAQPMNTTNPEPASAQPVLMAPVAIATKKSEQPHGFLDRTNSLGFAAMAGSLTADAFPHKRPVISPISRDEPTRPALCANAYRGRLLHGWQLRISHRGNVPGPQNKPPQAGKDHAFRDRRMGSLPRPAGIIIWFQR